MCEVATYVAIASALIGAGTSAYSSNQNDQAMAAATDAESRRQQQMQDRQKQLIQQQEQQKEQARKIFQGLVPETNEDKLATERDAYTQKLTPQYQQVAAPVNADPTADGTNITTVGSTSSGTTGSPAVDRAYAQELNRALSMNNQSAGARAFLDAIGFAQRDSQSRLQRGQEGIAQTTSFLNGYGRNIGRLEGLKDASNVDYQNQLALARTKGDTAALVGQGLKTVGNVGYGYATS